MAVCGICGEYDIEHPLDDRCSKGHNHWVELSDFENPSLGAWIGDSARQLQISIEELKKRVIDSRERETIMYSVGIFDPVEGFPLYETEVSAFSEKHAIRKAQDNFQSDMKFVATPLFHQPEWEQGSMQFCTWLLDTEENMWSCACEGKQDTVDREWDHCPSWE